MFEHYALYEINKLTDRFGLTDGVPRGVKPRYNISPAGPASVIVSSLGKTEMHRMYWGLVPDGANDNNSVFRYKTFTTKSEKVFSKPDWNSAVRQRRCIVPANGFYIYRERLDSKEAYYFTLADQSLAGLAGIYSSWTDPQGIEQRTFSVLTIEANDTVPTYIKRMPVIVHPDDEAKWLDSDVNEFGSLIKMMRPYEGEPLAFHRVSDEIMHTKQNSPHLIVPFEQ